MSSSSAPFRVAAVQVAPVFLDREATLERACTKLAEAAANGARLAVFPEAFVPSYPFWVWHVPAGESAVLRELYAELLEQAIEVPGPATARLGAAAREAGVHLAIGVNERNREASGTSLYNSLLWFDAGGCLLGCHRKLVPTGGERLVHAPGDGSTLAVYDTELGRLSGLVCWENYMPLARYALYAWGAELWVAPTWDHGEPWLSTLRHIAKEGRVHVIGCCSAVRTRDVPDRWAWKGAWLRSAGEWINPGDSAIVDPDGKLLAGPLHGEEGILYAEIDPRRARGTRSQLDVAGHYARPDVFQLTVQRGPRPVVSVAGEEAPPAAGSEPER